MSCASGRVMRISDVKVTGPKILAFDAPSAPWVIEIQNRLKKEGFRIKRWSSRTRVSDRVSESRMEHFNQSEARYILVIEGYAPLDWGRRCLGGGYRFSSISVDMVDTVTNETVFNVNGSGYSENCPPLSGSIFSDITEAVVDVWE